VILLGIDPGLCTTGYGVISAERGKFRLVEAGIIRPKPTFPLERRLLELYNGLLEVIRSMMPGVMVVEEIWVGDRDPSVALVMGHARGALCLAAATENVPVEHLAHATVKRALTGSGGAKKHQVKRMVVELLGLRVTPEPDDVSDALAVALARANMRATDRKE
jgi:crossover junction endodeoxyribonuclease RuvC